MKKLISMLVLGMLVVSSVAAFAGETKPEGDNQTQSKYFAADTKEGDNQTQSKYFAEDAKPETKEEPLPEKK